MNFLKHLKKPKVRASAESTLIASTNLPNSGLAFVDNSQGCSAAVAELSNLLDIALDQFDCEGEASDQLQLQLKRLYDEAGKYANSRLNDTVETDQWECTFQEAEIISIAFACAAAVYQPEGNAAVPGFAFQRESRISPSIGGTVKATDIFFVRPVNAGVRVNERLPVLVVSIRGTASRVDRMVNLNGESKEMIYLRPANSEDKHQPIYAHAGFLNGAEGLVASVSRKIEEITRRVPVKHILFTGHSAGGAVASLLFTKFLSCARTDYPPVKFSMISFGAPPVTKPNINSKIMDSNSPYAANRGLVLSIVNEYDLVPRADQAYIRSLVDLYRSIYSLPPLIETDLGQESNEIVLPQLSFDLKDRALEKVWSLPRPVYWHIGKLVVLKVKLVEKSGNGCEDDEWVLNVLTLRAEEFARLLFCNVDIHKRFRYHERVEMLMGGQFNGKLTWQYESATIT